MSGRDTLPTGIVADAFYREHATSPGHPECPDRFDAARAGSLDGVSGSARLDIPSRKATRSELLLCHTEAYVQSVDEDVSMGRPTLRTGDTDIGSASFEVASRAVGGVLNAVDSVLKQETKNAFCVLRPPGHHAESDRGMGFCIFNNAAIAARYAMQHEGVDRVLIADWDVHHGNGTQWIFYDDPSVFYFSTHQWPHFPGTGKRDDIGTGAGLGFTRNAPMSAGSGRQEVLGAFRDVLVPAMRTFEPQFVILSAGFDCEAGDPLGGFCLQEQDFIELTEIMLKIADTHAEGRLVSVLEGGYRLKGVTQLCRAHVATLAAG